MSKVINNKMDIYRKRQNILLIIVGIIIVLAILVLVYFIAFNDNHDISQTAIENSIPDNLEAVPADGQEETVNKNSVSFESDRVQIAVGEKLVPTVLNGTVADIINWQSADALIASVTPNGEITGMSTGLTAITAEVAGTKKLLTLQIDVTSVEETTENENLTEKGYEIVEEDGLTYIYDILIANKSYSLPSDYNPGIDDESLSAFYIMQSDAAYEGLDLYISSDFRSYETQDRLYNNYASYDGYELADTYSARPGHSEHQTGMAFDLNTIDNAFADTAEGQWIKENCHKYGFIIRYPEGKEHITGYIYEPWHIRYLGVDKATEVYESGLTLEEFLGIDSVYTD